jgi:hypothetical protein
MLNDERAPFDIATTPSIVLCTSHAYYERDLSTSFVVHPSVRLGRALHMTVEQYCS